MCIGMCSTNYLFNVDTLEWIDKQDGYLSNIYQFLEEKKHKTNLICPPLT